MNWFIVSSPSNNDRIETIPFIAILSWFIWKARNAYVFEGKATVIINIFFNSYRLQRDSKRVFSSSKVDLGLLVIYFWSPSLIGCLKINFDVAFSSSSHAVSLGLIFRDANGCVLYALVSWASPQIPYSLPNV